MDRNTILGLLLIFGIMIGFSYLNRPSQEQLEDTRRRNDSIALLRVEQEIVQREMELKAERSESVQPTTTTPKEQRTGTFAKAYDGEQKLITLENELIKVYVSTLGGSIYSVELKDYKTYHGDPLSLFDGDQNQFGLEFWGNNNHIQTQKLFFTPSTDRTAITISEGATPYTLTMRLEAAEGSYIDYIYTLEPNSYKVDFSIQLTGMDNIISSRLGTLDLIWDATLPSLEKNNKTETEYSNIAIRYPNEEYEEISSRGDKASKSITTRLQWLGYKHQFFSTFLVAEEPFTNATLESTVMEDDRYTKQFVSQISIPFENGRNEIHNFKFFFVPNHYHTLINFEYGFEDVIPLGSWIIKWINRYVIIFLFNVLDNHIASYGLIILLLTIIIKVVLFPLTYKSYVSQARMRVLKPQVDELNTKFPKKEDAMKKQQAVMGLYKKAGVNPMGGCLPMLIQFPFLIAMFRFFPASFELRQKSFLWAEDLSTYDSILDLPFTIPFYGDHISLFTLLMAAALFVTSRTSMSQMGDTNAQMPGMKFMMLYMMPVMLLVWFNSYSAGLSYYYFLSNVITMGQTYLIRQTVDDQAILKKMTENAKKPVKKSKFQEKLEKMTKQQQAAKKRK